MEDSSFLKKLDKARSKGREIIREKSDEVSKVADGFIEECKLKILDAMSKGKTSVVVPNPHGQDVGILTRTRFRAIEFVTGVTVRHSSGNLKLFTGVIKELIFEWRL